MQDFTGLSACKTTAFPADFSSESVCQFLFEAFFFRKLSFHQTEKSFQVCTAAEAESFFDLNYSLFFLSVSMAKRLSSLEPAHRLKFEQVPAQFCIP